MTTSYNTYKPHSSDLIVTSMCLQLTHPHLIPDLEAKVAALAWKITGVTTVRVVDAPCDIQEAFGITQEPDDYD